MNSVSLYLYSVCFVSFIYNLCHVLMYIEDQTPPYKHSHSRNLESVSRSLRARVRARLVTRMGESISFTHHWALKGPDVLWRDSVEAVQ